MGFSDIIGSVTDLKIVRFLFDTKLSTAASYSNAKVGVAQFAVPPKSERSHWRVMSDKIPSSPVCENLARCQHTILIQIPPETCEKGTIGLFWNF